ncbi:MAG TPA: pyridoxal-phosphate dependent enzyme [Candidatus Polarisedimenticolaceae bacterium]|nr:pyridoxal-phosphate dependent enzyme [Candidatus Polarisedimenticolaceae bacterium]
MDVRRLATEAFARLAPCLPATPVEESPMLGRVVGGRVFLKLENRQPSGSFKIRGVMNRLLAMPAERRRDGVVAASTGNHGLALAHASRVLAVPAVVFAPETARPAKIEALRASGVELRLSGEDCLDAERAARRFARERGAVYLSPYNDPYVVGGQATIGVELVDRPGPVDALVASLGGGGLIGGAGGYLKTEPTAALVIAGSPANSPAMHRSIEARRVVATPSRPTLSDATAGDVEPGAITFELCRRTIDHSVLVDEDAILDGVRTIRREHGMWIEGAAGVAVAAFFAAAALLRGARVVIVICGGNVDPSLAGRVAKITRK